MASSKTYVNEGVDLSSDMQTFDIPFVANKQCVI
jgi:hypothetical protein